MKSKYKPEVRMIRRQAKMHKCLLLKGGVCNVCKISLLQEPWNATFHHRNGKDDKIIEMSQVMDCNINTITQELEKCDLLCHRCHRKIHFNVELFEKHYDEICEVSQIHDGKKFTKINYEKVYELAKLGAKATKIAQELGRSPREIRRVLRDMSNRTGEQLIQTKGEWLSNARKATDEEILTAYKQGMYRDEMEKKFDMCSGVLSRRISRLKKFGLLPKGQRKGYKKRTTKKHKKIYSYADAQNVAQSLGIKTRSEFRKRYKEDPMLPVNPDEIYKGEWHGWSEFTGIPRYGRKK